MKKEFNFGENNNYAVAYEVESPIAIVQLVHGMTEHIGRYEEFALKLNEAGYTVYGHDNIGHGRTVKKKEDFGYFPNNETSLINDIESLNKEIRKKYTDKKIILFGHSFGSLLARYYACSYSDNISALIIMGTAQESYLKMQFAIFITKLFILFKGEKYRSKLLFFLTFGLFSIRFNKQKVPSWLTRDENKYKIRMSDKLCCFLPTCNMQLNIFKITKYVSKKENIDKIPKDLPLLILSGEKDPVGRFTKGIKEFNYILEKLKFRNKRILIYENARHELINEINREEVFEDIITWLDSNFKKQL